MYMEAYLKTIPSMPDSSKEPVQHMLLMQSLPINLDYLDELESEFEDLNRKEQIKFRQRQPQSFGWGRNNFFS